MPEPAPDPALQPVPDLAHDYREPDDPLTELLALLRQARREVAVTLPGPVEFCVVHRREVVHRLTRCTRRMGWLQA